jgi:hypothetical protein
MPGLRRIRKPVQLGKQVNANSDHNLLVEASSAWIAGSEI